MKIPGIGKIKRLLRFEKTIVFEGYVVANVILPSGKERLVIQDQPDYPDQDPPKATVIMDGREV